MVEIYGIAPYLQVCKTRVLLLSLYPRKMARRLRAARRKTGFGDLSARWCAAYGSGTWSFTTINKLMRLVGLSTFPQINKEQTPFHSFQSQSRVLAERFSVSGTPPKKPLELKKYAHFLKNTRNIFSLLLPDSHILTESLPISS
jgi:hypothetical protein